MTFFTLDLFLAANGTSRAWNRKTFRFQLEFLWFYLGPLILGASDFVVNKRHLLYQNFRNHRGRRRILLAHALWFNISFCYFPSSMTNTFLKNLQRVVILVRNGVIIYISHHRALLARLADEIWWFSSDAYLSSLGSCCVFDYQRIGAAIDLLVESVR